MTPKSEIFLSVLGSTIFIKIFSYLSGNFQNRNLGPNPWDQINLIYNVPEEDFIAAAEPNVLDPILETSLHQEVPSFSESQWAQDSLKMIQNAQPL